MCAAPAVEITILPHIIPRDDVTVVMRSYGKSSKDRYRQLIFTPRPLLAADVLS